MTHNRRRSWLPTAGALVVALLMLALAALVVTAL